MSDAIYWVRDTVTGEKHGPYVLKLAHRVASSHTATTGHPTEIIDPAGVYRTVSLAAD